MPVFLNFTFPIVWALLLIEGFSSIPTNVHSSTASQMADYMDVKIDPCRDFYQFACGGFLEKTVLGLKGRGNNRTVAAVKKIKEQFRILLEEESPPDEPKPFTMAKNFQKVCVDDKSASAEEVVSNIVTYLKTFLGSWPLFENSWQDENFDWKALVSKSRGLGFPSCALSPISVRVDSENKTERVIRIGKMFFDSSLQICWNYMKTDFRIDLLLHVMKNSTIDLPTAREQLLEAVRFMCEIERIPTSPIEQALSPIALEDLEANYSMNPWREYIRTTLGPHFQIGKNEIVKVDDLTFVEEFEILAQSTPKRIVANYLMLNAFIDACNHVFRSNFEDPKASQNCAIATTRELKDIVHSMYVKKYLRGGSNKRNASEMSEMIRKKFNNILHENDWIDNGIRLAILEKSELIRFDIGYSDALEDVNKLAETFKDLDLDQPTSYLDAMLKLQLFKDKHSNLMKSYHFHSMRHIRHKYRSNEIRIPADVLREPFFNIDRPRYLDFGALGWVIGQEIALVFGREFFTSDKFGRLVLKNEKVLEIQKKLGCFIRHSRFKDLGSDMTADEIPTLTENVADNGGIKVAYLAYQEWVKRNGREPRLPGLDYSSNQLFWISAAQSHCTSANRGSLKNNYKKNHHSSEKFRIFNSFSNRPEFAKDFNCNSHAKYNPWKRCSIW